MTLHVITCQADEFGALCCGRHCLHFMGMPCTQAAAYEVSRNPAHAPSFLPQSIARLDAFFAAGGSLVAMMDRARARAAKAGQQVAW